MRQLNSPKTAKHGRDFFHDHSQAKPLLLQSCVESIIILRGSGEDTIDERLPFFLKTLMIWMPLIGPMREQACFFGGVMPEKTTVLESGFILIKEAAHDES